MTRRKLLLVFVIVLLLPGTGCWFRKKQPLPPPTTPPITTPTSPVPPVRKVDVPSEPPVPKIEVQPPPPLPAPRKAEEDEEEEEEAQAPARTPQTRPPNASRGPAKKPATAARPPDPQPTQQPAPVGRLEQILTDEQKNEYRRNYTQSESAARQLIVNISPNRLNAEQQDVLARIQSFLQQASEATATDMSLAAQLARRAELLARDLVKGLQ